MFSYQNRGSRTSNVERDAPAYLRYAQTAHTRVTMDLSPYLLLLQYPGICFGLIGAVFVSLSQARYRRWGFMLWICSNACLITYAIEVILVNRQDPHSDPNKDPWGLLAMYVVYTATSILGWWNNREPVSPRVTAPS